VGDRRGDDDEAGASNGIGQRGGGFVAPRLFGDLQTHFGPPRPNNDAVGEIAFARRAGDGSAEQAGGDDGQPIEHASLQE